MIYLDYSATTKTDSDILDIYRRFNDNYWYNSNSSYSVGIQNAKLVQSAIDEIAKLLKVKSSEIIMCSGATEANNMAIKGIRKYANRGKIIIRSSKEHSSVIDSFKYLKDYGYQEYVLKNNANYLVDLKDLEEHMNDEVSLVSIALVSSELGIIEDIDSIKKIVKKYPKCLLHVDITQALGKIPVDLEDIDLASCSMHKIFGLKNSGILIKKENVDIEKLMSGGLAISKYRSGTFDTAVVLCAYKTITKALNDLNKHLEQVTILNEDLKQFFIEQNCVINSIGASPYILNISTCKIASETLIRMLDNQNVYLSAMSACSSNTKSVLLEELTRDNKISTTSIRISLSYKTTKDEIIEFKNIMKKILNNKEEKCI